MLAPLVFKSSSWRYRRMKIKKNLSFKLWQQISESFSLFLQIFHCLFCIVSCNCSPWCKIVAITINSNRLSILSLNLRNMVKSALFLDGRYYDKYFYVTCGVMTFCCEESSESPKNSIWEIKNVKNAYFGK